jgi:chromosome segregation ATPase
MNILENEISNLANDRQRLSDSFSNLRKAENQLQLTIKELQAKRPKLVLQRERTEYFVKEYHENNVEYKG